MNIIHDDIKLIERLKTGDVEAFDLVYEKYSGKLYAFGLKYLHSTDEAEELVQAVFLKIWENHKLIDKELSFKAYLFTIAYNDICKLFRKRNYQQKFIKETLYEDSHSTSVVEEGIDFQSVMERVQQIIDKLPKRQKIIFLKSRQDGKSSKEIAAELNLSPGTVDNYISEALRFIRSRLHKEDLAFMLYALLFLF